MEKKLTVVFIHGAYHDSWSFHPVGELLDEAGIDWIAPDLPLRTYRGDSDMARSAIEPLSGDVVVVAHSRGGIVASFATAGLSRVKAIIYVAALMLDEGQTVIPNRRGTLRSKALRTVDGQMTIDPELATELFYADCDPDLAARAVTRLRPTGFDDGADVVGAAVGWKSIPSTYVVCTRDRCVHPDDQRDCAVRASEMIELESGHTPMFSRPVELAAIVMDKCRQLSDRQSG